jgi:copper chaperone CopZ/quercetin dioxygenase-like cupin family protein
MPVMHKRGKQKMTETQKISNWKEEVRYSADGPQHTVLIDTGSYRAVLVGLEAGVRIPPHPSSDATYHFLEGSGSMIVDGERHAIESGSTLVVPAGAERGVEAETRLAFLGSHGGHKQLTPHADDPSDPARKPNRRPMLMFGLMTIFMLAVMVGLWQIGASPMAAMLSSYYDLGAGVWGVMLVPMLGLLGLGVMMFFMYRTMLRRAGPMGSGMNSAKHFAMMKERQDMHEMPVDPSLETLTYTIPAVSCGGCKQTIEEKVRELEGVAAVRVEVDSKTAVVSYEPPATEKEIELLLERIGYPADAG